MNIDPEVRYLVEKICKIDTSNVVNEGVGGAIFGGLAGSALSGGNPLAIAAGGLLGHQAGEALSDDFNSRDDDLSKPPKKKESLKGKKFDSVFKLIRALHKRYKGSTFYPDPTSDHVYEIWSGDRVIGTWNDINKEFAPYSGLYNDLSDALSDSIYDR